MKAATHNLIARTRRDVAEYVLNHKRAHLRALEERFVITIMVIADETVTAPQAFVVDRGELVHSVEAAHLIAEQHQAAAVAAPLEEEDDLEGDSIVEEVEEESIEMEAPSPSIEPEHGEEDGPPRRRRRRGRGGRGRSDEHRRHEQIPISEDGTEPAGEHVAPADDEAMAGNDDAAEPQGESPDGERDEQPDVQGERPEPQQDGERRRRRRGRRGGRRNRHERNGNDLHADSHGNDSHGDDRGSPTPEHGFAPGEESSAPLAVEPETRTAVADLDAAPPPPQPAPVREVPAPEPEAPRRRSTVRERAPVSHGESAPPSVPAPPAAPATVSEPVVETSETEDAGQPRKTGWWSRRFGGG